MRADPLSIGKILSERQRFVVPIYQRTYTWTRRELEPLVEQIKGKADEAIETGGVAFSHYMGALLLIPDSEVSFGRIQPFNVVDGQQRLTTFQLCFAALREIAAKQGFAELSRQLADLLVQGETASMADPATERYKLQPTQFDRQMFYRIVDLDRGQLRTLYPDAFYKNGKIRPSAPEMLFAYCFFLDEIGHFVGAGAFGDEVVTHGDDIRRRLLAVSTVLFENFRLIVITLSKEDDAQVIFETLNSGGKPLAAMDLVRNDVFYRASRRGEDQRALMDAHWSIFEAEFWKQEQVQGRIRKPRIDFFLSHVLAAEQGRVMSLGELFAEYKRFVKLRAFPDIRSELDVLTRYAPVYSRLVTGVGDDALGQLARRLSTFDVTTAYPLVLVIATSDADDAVKDRLYDLIQSYIVRRALSYLTSANYNNIFVEIVAAMRQDGVSEATFGAYFDARSGADTARFPTDDAFAAAIASRPQYGWMPQPRLKSILQSLEFAARDKFNVNGSLQDGLSVEHVLPQSWAAAWPLPSGRSAPPDLFTGVDEAMKREIDRRATYVHRLGNLTLLTPASNTSAGNQGFEAKKRRLGESLLKTNVAITSAPAWSEAEIDARAAQQAAWAIRLWPFPA